MISPHNSLQELMAKYEEEGLVDSLIEDKDWQRLSPPQNEPSSTLKLVLTLKL